MALLQCVQAFAWRRTGWRLIGAMWLCWTTAANFAWSQQDDEAANVLREINQRIAAGERLRVDLKIQVENVQTRLALLGR
ncbi:MAG: hypothetical protein MI861_15465, partial [Pirellulales bacterium]|nr:hypothetical protein [Pirellulales bacterium]